MAGQQKTRKFLILLFPLLFVLFSTVLNPSEENPAIGKMLGIAVWMLGWWITEVVPVAITSLLPVILFPLMGISSGTEISRYYFSDIIFLYIGGFMLALAIEKWEVHRRIATKTLMFFGQGTFQIYIGFMLTTSFLSMWMSNTAIALLMLPFAVSVLDELKEVYSEKELGNFKVALLLGVAFASSIGGITTPIGTPTNLVFFQIYETSFPQGHKVNFANWTIFCFPIYLVLIFSAIVILYLFYKPKKQLEILDNSFFKIAHLKLGKRTYEQNIVLLVFILFAILMVFRGNIEVGDFKIPGWSSFFERADFINDGVVAIFISVLLFLIPSKSYPGNFIMDWSTALRIPWGIIFLFGGGFALEKGFEISELNLWIASKMDILSGSHIFLIILTASFLMLLLTEFAANVTIAQSVLPLCIAISITLGIDPLYLMLPMTLCASMSFILPSSTPPNTIVYGTEQIKTKQMVIPGIIMVIISGIVISIMTYYWGSFVFGL